MVCKNIIVQVVTEPVQWEGGLAGVNNFGFGGVNCHVLLSSNQKTKVNYAAPSDNLPRLACISGRTEEAVDVVLTEVNIRLMHPINSMIFKLFSAFDSSLAE